MKNTLKIKIIGTQLLLLVVTITLGYSTIENQPFNTYLFNFTLCQLVALVAFFIYCIWDSE